MFCREMLFYCFQTCSLQSMTVKCYQFKWYWGDTWINQYGHTYNDHMAYMPRSNLKYLKYIHRCSLKSFTPTPQPLSPLLSPNLLLFIHKANWFWPHGEKNFLSQIVMILNFRCPNIRDFITTGNTIVVMASHCCYNELCLFQKVPVQPL